MSYLDTLVVPESEVPYPIWVPKHESRSGKNTGVVVGIALMIVGSFLLLIAIVKKIIKWWDIRELAKMRGLQGDGMGFVGTYDEDDVDKMYNDNVGDDSDYAGVPGGTFVATDPPSGSGGQLDAAGGPGDDSARAGSTVWGVAV